MHPDNYVVKYFTSISSASGCSQRSVHQRFRIHPWPASRRKQPAPPFQTPIRRHHTQPDDPWQMELEHRDTRVNFTSSPFQVGQQFVVHILARQDSYAIFVDGKYTCSYPYGFPTNSARYFSLSGRVQLIQMSV